MYIQGVIMTTGSNEGAKTGDLPLFYQKPVVLHVQTHAQWRLKDGDMGFAAQTPFAPLVLSEFGEAGRFYPVVFAAETLFPIALLGLSEGHNLFIEDHQWIEGHYVPAYVRRYPFGFVAVPDSDRFALAVDTASDRLILDGDEGAPFFENGLPGELTQQALQFCEAYQTEYSHTQEFAQALQKQGLLVEKRADATLPDGRKYALDGFLVVDGERFRDLDDAVIVEWHRKGWLGLVHMHLLSLGRLANLMEKQARIAV